MIRHSTLASILLVAGSVSASADVALTTRLISSSATTEVYEVRLTGAPDLAAYNIEMILKAQGLTGPSMVAAAAPAAAYVFPDASNYFAASNLAGNEVRLTLTDFSASPVDTVAGVNDVVSLVTVDTSSVTGPVSVGFAVDSLVLNNAAGDPIAGYDELKRTLASVPEPSPLLLAALASGLVFVHEVTRRPRTPAGKPA